MNGNVGICRERVLSVVTIELLLILLNRGTCSFAVISACLHLLQLINSYGMSWTLFSVEIGQSNLRILCAVDYLKRLDEGLKEVDSLHSLITQLIEDITYAEPKISASEISSRCLCE